MSDLISRREVLNVLCDNCDSVSAVCPHCPCERFIAIEALPTIDPAKKGKWIKLDGSLWNMANCSECGEMCVLGDTAKFCPFCGASMVGVITKKRGRR